MTLGAKIHRPPELAGGPARALRVLLAAVVTASPLPVKRSCLHSVKKARASSAEVRTVTPVLDRVLRAWNVAEPAIATAHCRQSCSVFPPAVATAEVA